MQRIGKVAHAPTVAFDEQIERVDLTGVKGRFAFAEQLVADRGPGRSASQFTPRKGDARNDVDVGNRWQSARRIGGDGRFGQAVGGAAHERNASE